MKKKTLKISGFLISGIVIFLFSLSIIYKNTIISFLSAQTGSYLLTLLFILSFLMELIPQYISAHLLIINIAILDMPLFYATVIITIGTFLGNIAGFEIGRKSSFQAFQKKELRKVENYISKYGKFFMFIAALSPLPYFPMIFGFLKIKRRDFVFFGMLPRIIGIILLSLFLAGEIF
jgi:membrane protein YqaA with SNARE-associated domain